MHVRRFDSSVIKDWNRTPQGGLRVPSFPTRIGVLKYLKSDGTIRNEYRPPEEVYRNESLQSLAYAPITDLHPAINGVNVHITPENYRQFSIGHVAEDVKPDNGFVSATLLIQDQSTIDKIERGDRRELSCGYACQLDMTSGVSPEGEIYDCIQRDITYNHVAIGPVGWNRSGSSVALRLDSVDAVQIEEALIIDMDKETIDGKEYTIGTADWAAAIRAHSAKLQGRTDALEKELTKIKNPKIFSTEVLRRVKLINDCQKAANIVGAKFDAAAATEMVEGEMIVQAIQLLDPSFDPANKSPDFLMGYFHALMASKKPVTAEETPLDANTNGENLPVDYSEVSEEKADAKKTIFDARRGTESTRKMDNADDINPDKARAEMIKRGQDAWKQPLSATKRSNR